MGNGSSRAGRNDKQRITPRDRAILDLKVQRDRLRQYQKKVAKEHAKNGNKSLALLALKKKKYQEGLLESTNAQLLNLEQLTSTIEFAQVEQQVIRGLKQGNIVLTALQKETLLEEVEKLMADTAEAVAYQNEISAMLAGKISQEEEEDLEEELRGLQSEAIETQQLSMPNVPQHVLSKSAEQGVSEDEQQIADDAISPGKMLETSLAA